MLRGTVASLYCIFSFGSVGFLLITYIIKKTNEIIAILVEIVLVCV